MYTQLMTRKKIPLSTRFVQTQPSKQPIASLFLERWHWLRYLAHDSTEVARPSPRVATEGGSGGFEKALCSLTDPVYQHHLTETSSTAPWELWFHLALDCYGSSSQLSGASTVQLLCFTPAFTYFLHVILSHCLCRLLECGSM